MKTVFAVLLMVLWSFNAFAETRFAFVSEKKEVQMGDCITASKSGLLIKQQTVESEYYSSYAFLWLTSNKRMYALEASMKTSTEMVVTCYLLVGE